MLLSRLKPFTGIDFAASGARELVREFISGILGQPVSPGELLTSAEWCWVFRYLSRAVELGKRYPVGERSVWTLADLDANERAGLDRPHLDEFVMQLRPRLRGMGRPVGTCWPEGRPFALCLSHDMDHVTAFAGRECWREFTRYAVRPEASAGEVVRRGCRGCRSLVANWARRNLVRQPDPFGNVGQWLKLEADCGFKSSLFFFADKVQPWHPFDCNYGFSDPVLFEGCRTTVQGMMREIASRGWDVGLHGSIASATTPGALISQKGQIEQVLQQPVLTTRQHFLEYDPLQTASLQAQAGLRADGTQGFNDTFGFRAGTSFPYRLWDWTTNQPLPLFEIPLHIQDGALLRHCRTVDRAVEACAGFMDRIAASGGCLSLLFHPAQLATDAGLSVYREVLWEARRRGAWGCSMRAVAEHWQRWLDTVFSPIVSPPGERRVPAVCAQSS